MMKDSDAIKMKYFPDGNYLGRSLSGYKTTQKAVAEARGVGEKLAAAKTLTEARKIVYGYKKGHTR